MTRAERLAAAKASMPRSPEAIQEERFRAWLATFNDPDSPVTNAIEIWLEEQWQLDEVLLDVNDDEAWVVDPQDTDDVYLRMPLPDWIQRLVRDPLTVALYRESHQQTAMSPQAFVLFAAVHEQNAGATERFLGQLRRDHERLTRERERATWLLARAKLYLDQLDQLIVLADRASAIRSEIGIYLQESGTTDAH